MPTIARGHRHGPIVLLTVIAVALGACSGTSATLQPSAVPASNEPVTGLGAAERAFANVDSYRFTMTLAGGTFNSMLSMLPTSSALGNAPFTMGGTIMVKPAAAADISMVGLHIIEIGGHDYMDVGGSGNFDQIPITGTMLAERFSPATMFSKTIDPTTVGGYDMVGSETRNGVQADHYQASAAGLARLGAIADISGATWSADVWIASDGGYPVGMAVVGEAADKSIAYEVLFEVTNVDDPANTVAAPPNVMGA